MIQSVEYRKVLIKWVDSKGVSNCWELLDELEPMQPCLCLSIGFIIEDTKEYVTIAQSMEESQVCGRMTIPKCAIKSIQDLEVIVK